MNENKHYNTLTEYYLKKYNHKVAKIALNAGFTCPNKDGKKGYGGCIYCSKLGSGDTAGNKDLPLKEQFKEIKEKIIKKWSDTYFIPYLQANSNTYAPLNKLKEIYEEILNIDENIVEFAIATRADCFTIELYDYLEQLNKRIPITIELGLQTANEETAKLIRRGLTNQEFKSCVIELRKRGIQVVAHIINGLPNETEQDMLNTIDFLNLLDIQGIKFHTLLLLKDTDLVNYYKKHPFHILTLEEYTHITAKQIAKLRPDIIIHRLCADTLPEEIIEPKWALKKLIVMNEIDKLLRKENLYQGDYFNKPSHHH